MVPSDPVPPGGPPDPGAVRVIAGWSTALRNGDISAAAAYFKLPSEMINGSGTPGEASVAQIGSEAQAREANASLPCGAKLISATQRGAYVNALFRLTGRPGPGGTNCGTGAGLTARTDFLIVKGRIAQWIRAPDEPGDNPGPQASPGAGGGPSV